MDLPEGVRIEAAAVHADLRGTLTPLYRESVQGVTLVQWNLARSVAGSLRGVHCHPDHDDFLIVIGGSMTLGLHDLRPGSPTEGMATVVVLDTATTALLPAGVAHGFWFPTGGDLVYGTTVEWTDATKFGCRWDDPELGLDWDADRPVVSERDADAGSLAELRAVVQSEFSVA